MNEKPQSVMKSPIFICTAVLLIAGIALFALSMFGDESLPFARWYLAGAMGCVVIANVLNLILIRKKRKG